MKVRLIAVALMASLSVSAMAQDPSIKEVYQAAEHGQMAEAQRMMGQVLKDHPDSARAHYVEAELLVRQGQYGQAKAELAQADRLQPGLPFAQPSAVSELRAKLAAPVQSTGQGALMPAQQAPAPHVPWGLIIAALAFVGVAFAWFRSRQQAVTVYSGQPQSLPTRPSGWNNGGNYGGTYGAAPYPGMPPAGPMPGTGGGLGSQMLGGLATGAAVGAGMVAGEALMHRFMGDDERRDLSSGLPVDEGLRRSEVQPDNSYDMGGQDFGMNDTGSWDDGGGSGGGSDDWS